MYRKLFEVFVVVALLSQLPVAWPSSTSALSPNTAPVPIANASRISGVNLMLDYGLRTLIFNNRDLASPDVQVPVRVSLVGITAVVTPTNVILTGPVTGTVNTAYTFAATVSPPTATTPITYAWQATGQSPVTNTAGLSNTITFTWSTPGAKAITVTVTNAGGRVTDTHFIVIDTVPRRITLAPSTMAQAGTPGTMVTYQLRAINIGDVSDTFTTTVSGDAWITDVPATIGPLAPDEGANVRVAVHIPLSASRGDYDVVTLTLTSVINPSMNAVAMLTTTAVALYRAELHPPQAVQVVNPGIVVMYSLALHNPNTVTQSYDLTRIGYLWPTMIYSESVDSLGPGKSTPVEVIVNVSGDAADGQSSLTRVEVRSKGGLDLLASSVLTTTVTTETIRHDVALQPYKMGRLGRPAQSVIYTLRLTNTGSVTDTFILSLKTGWEGALAPRSVVLSRGQGYTVSAVITVPVGTPAGQRDMATVTVASMSDPSVQAVAILATTVIDVPTVQFSAASYSQREDAGEATVTVTLDIAPTQAVSVDYATRDRTATAGEDYIAVSGRLAFTPGTMVQTFTVRLLNDSLTEPDETVVLTLSNPGTVALGRPVSATLTIVDDDKRVYLPLILQDWPPTCTSPELYSINNPDGIGSYTVSWELCNLATSYVLEEDTECEVSKVYTVTETSYSAPGYGAARYYYRVKACNSYGCSGWSNTEWVDVLWEAEPNKDSTMANGPLVSGLTYYGVFPSGDDVQDYFYFCLTTTQRMEFWLTNIPAGSDYDIYIRDANLRIVAYSDKYSNASEYGLTGVLPAGRYYIQVFNRSHTGSTRSYRLKVVYQ